MTLFLFGIAAASAFAVRALIWHADRCARKVKPDVRFLLRGYPR